MAALIQAHALIQAWALTGFRPLLLFWSIVLGLAAGTVIGLQFAGPVPRPAARVLALGVSPPVLAAIRPARVPATDSHPAPLPALTGASIPEPVPAMLEPGTALPDRLLPVAGGPGRVPSQVYAAGFDPAERHPRIALVIDGAGLDRGLTAQLIATLPSAIDLAFSAYAPPEVAASLAAQARRLGRECLVSIPMEPSGFPNAEEGDKALLLGNTHAANAENLERALSSVSGCVGATGGSDGLDGERYAESNEAFAEILSTIEQRGLIYLDSRPVTDLAVRPVPGHKPFVVDAIIDRADENGDPPDAQAIDANLAKLAQIAAHRGSAIGLAGPPTPVLLDRLAVWAHGLAAQGLVLAPLTAMPAPVAPVPVQAAALP